MKKRAPKVIHKDTIYAFHLSQKFQNGVEIITYEDKKTKKTRRVYELLVQSEEPNQSSDEAKGYVTRLREWLWETTIDKKLAFLNNLQTRLKLCNNFKVFLPVSISIAGLTNHIL